MFDVLDLQTLPLNELNSTSPTILPTIDTGGYSTESFECNTCG